MIEESNNTVEYRAFENEKECWAEMLKHEPFGWVKLIDGGHKMNITKIGLGITFSALPLGGLWNNLVIPYGVAFKSYTFVDGTPFGIKKKGE